MCIIRFHARAGYLQQYETMLKEINLHPGSEEVPDDQYAVETVALADRNFNVPCETGIRYPSLIAMLNRQDMRWSPSVCTKYCICLYIQVCTVLFGISLVLYIYVLVCICLINY
jgi:hypothetical protein